MPRIPRLQVASGARRLVRGAAIGLLVAVVLALLRETDLFQSLELPLVDARTRHFAGDRAADARIVIAQIEETDIAAVRRQLGVRWPWPLEYNAHLVRVIDEAGAAALMVDILHLDRGAGPDDVPGTEELPPAARQQREIEAAGAAEYGAALKAFGKAAVAFELSDDPQYEVEARARVARTRLGTEAAPVAGIHRRGAELPVRRVAENAGLLGFSNAVPDLDGVVRRAAVVGRWGDLAVLSLPLATARLARGARGLPAQSLNDDGSFLVNPQRADFRGGYARVAPIQMLEWAMTREAEGALPPAAKAALEGKIVVLGVNAAGVKDTIASPLGGTMDGPVFQATVLDNLLNGDGRARQPRTTNLVILALLAVLTGAACAAAGGRVLPHVPPLVLGAGCVLLGYAWFEGGRSIDLFTPLLGIGLAWGGATALRALTEGRRNRWLESTFGRYMAPSIIEALKEDPALLDLGGREREVSVLFSDVAGFTGMSARLAPADVVELLNRYLTDHCRAVLEEDGVVDKFEGDAVMAFWGDPVPQADHAARACRTALRVQGQLPRLGPELARLGLASFTVRIGINTGAAVVGNMGSDQRFEYTCMGDTVNLASRLEGAGKVFGAPILAGPHTAAAAAEAILCKPLGRVVVVGRSDGIELFEVLAQRSEASQDLASHVERFEQALAAAREGRLDDARRALDEAEALRPGDGPCAWFRGVLEGLDGPWDGLTVLTAK